MSIEIPSAALVLSARSPSSKPVGSRERVGVISQILRSAFWFTVKSPLLSRSPLLNSGGAPFGDAHPGGGMGRSGAGLHTRPGGSVPVARNTAVARTHVVPSWAMDASATAILVPLRTMPLPTSSGTLLTGLNRSTVNRAGTNPAGQCVSSRRASTPHTPGPLS